MESQTRYFLNWNYVNIKMVYIFNLSAVFKTTFLLLKTNVIAVN
jgi:hypothetical protein